MDASAILTRVRCAEFRAEEAAILQSFPQDYVFYPTDMIEPVARMIGNAVPPRLAEYFSRYLSDALVSADG
ncbi:DNA cytosine methyltransferase [Caballeronia sp. CLC5]|uniref:DNA cytosine methyltransferase n=1 Tax=Caballeronia sp. CLC5 TaxID=2906764 RepID=UPI001F488C32|nr:DNA cytosine methyltransferase [Caballeronia sp. CLC5]MCE4570445.1 DNA cytosine methyltransferase [Caballeronia sp. CLC5]